MRSIWYKYYLRKLLTRVKELIRIVKTNKIRKMYEKDLVKYPKGKVKFLFTETTLTEYYKQKYPEVFK